MIRTFCEDLYARLMAELKEAGTLAEKMAVVRRYLRWLKEYVLAYSFADAAEERWFYKTMKPGFYCWQYYLREQFHVTHALPKTGTERKRKALLRQQDHYRAFLAVHHWWYLYYQQGMTQLDELWFMRGAEVPDNLLPEVLDLDPAFGTALDNLFARFKAMDMILADIDTALAGLEHEGLAPPLSSTMVDAKGRLLRPLRWTGEPINLKELAYGIHLRGQVNGGEIGIVALFKQLGDLFGVDLGIPKSALDDMMGRKKYSRTRFLDELTAALVQKMDEEDSWPGHPGKNKTGF